MTAQKSAQGRCTWPGIDDPIYTAYHDTEWGVPLTDDRALYEKLVLESFQSGLSWLTILKKRENFRRAFDNFDAATVAAYGPRDIERLMNDAGIVRNRRKIEAAIQNARAVLKLAATEATTLERFLWSFAPPPEDARTPRAMTDIATETASSRALAKALKARGFAHLGPTSLYAMMQSTGMVNDHLATCHRRAACAKLQAAQRKRMP